MAGTRLPRTFGSREWSFKRWSEKNERERIDVPAGFAKKEMLKLKMQLLKCNNDEMCNLIQGRVKDLESDIKKVEEKLEWIGICSIIIQCMKLNVIVRTMTRSF